MANCLQCGDEHLDSGEAHVCDHRHDRHRMRPHSGCIACCTCELANPPARVSTTIGQCVFHKFVGNQEEAEVGVD